MGTHGDADGTGVGRPTGGSRSALLPILSPAFGVVTGAMVAAMMFSTLCLALLGALLLFLAASARAAQTAVVAIAASSTPQEKPTHPFAKAARAAMRLT